MEKLSDIAIIILNYNNYQLTIEAVESIHSMTKDINIVVVDNYSPNESWTELNKYKNKNDRNNLYLIRTEKNTGYACGNNFGIQFVREHLESPYVVIMNPDVKIRTMNMFADLMKILSQHENVGAVTVQTIFNGRIDYPSDCCWKFFNRRQLLFNNTVMGKILGKSELYKKLKIEDGFAYVDIVQGCFFMVKLSTLNLIEDFDPNTFLYCEESILAKKLLGKGFRNAVAVEYYIEHNHIVKNKGLMKYKNKVFDMKCFYKSKKYYIKKYSGYGRVFRIFAYISLSLDYTLKKIIYRLMLK